MVVIPTDKPVITGMNSYYLRVDRLIEHYNGECASGGILFQSPTANGIVFFDDHIPLSGIFETKSETFVGAAAIERILERVSTSNFRVSVFDIDSDMILYWANMANAKPLYTNLSTEFTDLKALISKMRSEKLTGFVKAALADERDSACVYLSFGHIIGGTYTWIDDSLHTDTNLVTDLVARAASEGGAFSVYQIDLNAAAASDMENSTSSDEEAPSDDTAEFSAAAVTAEPTAIDLEMLEEFLNTFEEMASQIKRYRKNFSTLLKKKFISKADRYDFLDPFAAEFEYADGRIRYTGSAPTATVIRGVVESVWELAAEMGLSKALTQALTPWTDRYKEIISVLDVEI
jgi:hypothetical protein